MTIEELRKEISLEVGPSSRQHAITENIEVLARRFAASQVERVFNSVNINTYTEGKGVLRVTAELEKHKRDIIKQLLEGL